MPSNVATLFSRSNKNRFILNYTQFIRKIAFSTIFRKRTIQNEMRIPKMLCLFHETMAVKRLNKSKLKKKRVRSKHFFHSYLLHFNNPNEVEPRVNVFVCKRVIDDKWEHKHWKLAYLPMQSTKICSMKRKCWFHSVV